jgi:hypothetical protein
MMPQDLRTFDPPGVTEVAKDVIIIDDSSQDAAQKSTMMYSAPSLTSSQAVSQSLRKELESSTS